MLVWIWFLFRYHVKKIAEKKIKTRKTVLKSHTVQQRGKRNDEIKFCKQRANTKYMTFQLLVFGIKFHSIFSAIGFPISLYIVRMIFLFFLLFFSFFFAIFFLLCRFYLSLFAACFLFAIILLKKYSKKTKRMILSMNQPLNTCSTMQPS